MNERVNERLMVLQPI